jgi:multiple sugar transport system substrate-binding protein
MRRIRGLGRLALAATAALTFAACGGSDSDSGGSGSSEPVDKSDASGDIVVWVHGGATDGEKAAAQKIVNGFNTSQTAIKASLKFIPDQQKVITATAAEDLADVIESDGEAMSANVYAGKLQALDGLVSQEVLDNQTASVTAQNTFAGDGKRYKLSQFDSGLALYGSTKQLTAAGVRIPTTWDDAWTADEFDAALKALAAKDKDGKVLDVKENYGLAGYSTYAFLPIVSSAGHLVIENGKSEGALNNAAVVDAFAKVAGWKQYTDANADDKAFVAGRVALSWVGHWVYNDYKKALGDDLAVIPLPDFGTGPKTGQGSLAWGIGAKSKNPEAAAVFLEYAMNDESVTAMTDANSAPPGTKTVTAASPLYKAGGPLQLYADALANSCGNNTPTADCLAVPRTISPGWPTINQQAGEAMNAIWTGGDPKALLDKAAKAIDQDFADNDGYAVK